MENVEREFFYLNWIDFVGWICVIRNDGLISISIDISKV